MNKRAAEDTVVIDESLSYDAAKRLARDADPEVRRALAARHDIRPEILYYLAEDPSPEVRREIARNLQTPRHADLLLASDADAAVRGDLAQKITRLAPDLSPQEKDKLYQLTLDTVEALVKDEVVRIREMLADALKDVSHAPASVIRRLAQDPELTVCGPVLECSPVLTDDDLLEIIESHPVQGAISAISRRAMVTETVSAAVVGSGDVEAITHLLDNPSAQIREDTLDRILDQAPDVERWHAPLVSRPQLSAGAARRITTFVKSSLLDKLRERSDLDESTVAAVEQAIDARLTETEAGLAAGEDSSLQRARKLNEEGKLTESLVFDSLMHRDRAFVAAALAVRANLHPNVVARAVQLKSAKGILAICWRAGFSMRLGSGLQTQLASIAPNAILRPAAGGTFPLDEAAMRWQLDFLADLKE